MSGNRAAARSPPLNCALAQRGTIPLPPRAPVLAEVGSEPLPLVGAGTDPCPAAAALAAAAAAQAAAEVIAAAVYTALTGLTAAGLERPAVAVSLITPAPASPGGAGMQPALAGGGLPARAGPPTAEKEVVSARPFTMPMMSFDPPAGAVPLLKRGGWCRPAHLR